ncbi:MAG TPA: asparagine--tRNA ligase, partial [Candidatus Fraserbacteria bacterium]|nr:asparagine--tRNA ligase [Candidatus Fraserbacteria bacterium]
MQPIRIAAIPQHLGEEVLIQGWLYHKRSSGAIQFLLLRDGSGLMQA